MANTSIHRVFLIDDEPIQNEMLKDYLSERFDYKFQLFENGEDAIKSMGEHPEIVIIDYHLSAQVPNAKNGVEVLKEIKEKYPEVHAIMVSGQDKIQVAVDSMKYGAYDYIVKGETAFARMENTLNRINQLNDAKTLHASSKKTIAFLIFAIVCILLLTVYLLLNGTKL
jgi:two-component system, OmpR family, response regulator